MKNINIPVGRSDFEYIRKNDFYYVDKTGLIEELLRTIATQVTLIITRPRRFGKTLGMSMMAEFFDIRKDSSALFESLSVSKNEDLCKCWMNQYPTIFISFRNVDGDDFNDAYGMLEGTISNIFMNHVYLLDSKAMHEVDKKVFLKIAERTATKSELKDSLLFLTHVMS